MTDISRRSALKAFVGLTAGIGAMGLAGCSSSAASSSASASQAAAAPSMPLPYDLAAAKRIVAEPWVTVSDVAADFLEGPVCDKEGNLILCYRFPAGKAMASRIIKVNAKGEISTLHETEPGIMLNGLALHKDGRIFAANVMGSILTFDAEGKQLTQLAAECNGKKLMPNDMAFGANGDLYVTSFSGNALTPAGGVYRLPAADNYTTIVPFQENMCTGNGIAFAPDFSCIWVAETALNRIDRIRVNPDGTNTASFLDPCVVYQGVGIAGPDGTRTDAKGNIYQVYNPGGYVAVLNNNAIPVACVVLSDRDKGDGLTTTSLAISNSEATGYLLSCGSRGTVIYKFAALDKGCPGFYLS